MIEDKRFFKVLAANDTGNSPGHQGGVVIPKEIAAFFPPVIQGVGPTSDVRLDVSLFVDGHYAGRANTRYQHQTWGGKRSPERRLTDNLGPLRNAAVAGDILVFQKNLEQDTFVSLHLVKQGSIEFSSLQSKIAGRRWGPLDQANPPVSLGEIELAQSQLEVMLQGNPSAFSESRRIEEVTTVKLARDHAFRQKLIKAYSGKCAMTERRFVVPTVGHVGLDAAHIIPVNLGGSDDPGNGLLLTKELHWAFDRGLLSVDETRKVFVPQSVQSLSGNEFLRDLHGTAIREPHDKRSRALDEAFSWHRENILVA